MDELEAVYAEKQELERENEALRASRGVTAPPGKSLGSFAPASRLVPGGRAFERVCSNIFPRLQCHVIRGNSIN